MYRRIEVLTQEVDGKQAELHREREAVDALTRKIQELQAVSGGFESLAAQGNEILCTLKEKNAQEDEQHRKFTEDFRDK